MIEHIYISDIDEHYAPPEKPILEVGFVGDTVFLFGRYEETDTRKFTTSENAHVAIDADLINAVKIALSQEREDLKRALGSDSTLRVALTA
jgi:hypothetical protein